MLARKKAGSKVHAKKAGCKGNAMEVEVFFTRLTLMSPENNEQLI